MEKENDVIGMEAEKAELKKKLEEKDASVAMWRSMYYESDREVGRLRKVLRMMSDMMDLIKEGGEE